MDAPLRPQSSSFSDENASCSNPEQHEADFPLSKKPRASDELARCLAMPPPPLNPLPNPPQYSRAANMQFFKTRMCARFRSGSCPYGANCHFAHSAEELRRTDSEHQRIHMYNICRLFYSGRGCTYGDTCQFVHIAPGTLKGEPDRERHPHRESSAICVRTTSEDLPEGDMGGGLRPSESVKVASSVGNSSVPNQRNIYWKTRLCIKWENTGRCPYGERCQYAHGRAELRKLGSAVSDCVNVEVSASNSPCNVPKDNSLPNDSSSNRETQEQLHQESLMRKELRRMSRIYADWIDEDPLDDDGN